MKGARAALRYAKAILNLAKESITICYLFTKRLKIVTTYKQC